MGLYQPQLGMCFSLTKPDLLGRFFKVLYFHPYFEDNDPRHGQFANVHRWHTVTEMAVARRQTLGLHMVPPDFDNPRAADSEVF